VKTYLEREEVEVLEQATTNARDRLFIRLLFRLGCRVSEALALNVEDIDLMQGTITIKHLKTRLKLSCTGCGQSLGRSHAFCPSCGSKVEKAQTGQQEYRRQRVLPIDCDTLSMLQDYIRRGGPVICGGQRLIFGINRHRAWQIVRECAEKAGLPKLVNPETGRIHNVSPHRLRDAFAVHAVKLYDSGDGLRLLQEHLGHASFNTTARYRKVAGEEHRRWYESLWGVRELKAGSLGSFPLDNNTLGLTKDE
jgi:integrase/recombinase XerD